MSLKMSHKIGSNIAFRFWLLLFLVHVSYGLNLGLISGDLKRTSNPLIIRKTSHHSPVTINIKSGLPKLPAVIPPVFTPKISKKPSAIKTKKKPLLTKALRLRKLPKLPKLRKLPKLPKLRKLPKVPRTLKLPKIPKLPLLPLIPPLPLIPKLPFLPLLPVLPPMPLLPRFSKVLKPIRIPILGKSTLKALGSEIRPIRVPAPNLKRNILEKLVKLRNDGSLTTAEFIRFKKLLL
ncbi:RNA-binding protein 12-like [Pararge aegeria]|uniref:RNA-binding protein 12-like n=1 Tax=Pararge aegeria TaxID=116150 RepID=UPI0019CFD534|nr:RNA-binding protein 12-like [Pararge aegeria]